MFKAYVLDLVEWFVFLNNIFENHNMLHILYPRAQFRTLLIKSLSLKAIDWIMIGMYEQFQMWENMNIYI